MAAIGVERADQISIYCVVSVGADVRKATINLFSPIVVNNGDRRARQVINTADGYATRDRAVPRTGQPDARRHARVRCAERHRARRPSTS